MRWDPAQSLLEIAFRSAPTCDLTLPCSFVFWTLLYATPAVWCALGFIAILKLNIDYLLLVIIAVLLRCDGQGSAADEAEVCLLQQSQDQSSAVGRPSMSRREGVFHVPGNTCVALTHACPALVAHLLAAEPT